MKIPENISFTRAEKAAMITCEVLSGLYIISYIVLMILGLISGLAILMLVITVVVTGIFTLCTVYPQWTNIVSKPENYTEKQFHGIRWGCLAAMFLFPAVFFVIIVTGNTNI